MQNKVRYSKGKRLKKGESELANGTYRYRYQSRNGKRVYIYAKTLDELRQKEETIETNKAYGIRVDSMNTTLDQLADSWFSLKKGLKENTYQNYLYMYNTFVRDELGRYKIMSIRYADILGFYNELVEVKGLKPNTVDNIHTVVHQVLDFAVQNNFLMNNPSDNALRHLKLESKQHTEKRISLTLAEQQLFIDYMLKHPQCNHWYPIFYIMLNTGMRVGEITGLRWQDVDLENNLITVDHTLVYFNHSENGCHYNIHTPKTRSGERNIPMLSGVKAAFEQERKFQQEAGIKCDVGIDGYSDFIFTNRYGNVHNQSTLNRALKRMIADCNREQLANHPKNADVTLLPNFSCHILRHTFATRLCESGVNIKVIQDVLGHADFDTTMNVYADATKDFKQQEFRELDRLMSNGGSSEKSDE
ncbi:tyrosine-type recombinase/integrase [Ruminococcus bicirculans (ex Wegman et al. 2014)]|uniref:tyrosine-type recombinase/integrase n=1 Tax=Ruminococcus bicirculans (ex Wegman et al. 2014) TaxID=1160721 RepID=UPI003FD8B455